MIADTLVASVFTVATFIILKDIVRMMFHNYDE